MVSEVTLNFSLNPFKIIGNCGAPQGSRLGPLLFLFYFILSMTSDFPFNILHQVTLLMTHVLSTHTKKSIISVIQNLQF